MVVLESWKEYFFLCWFSYLPILTFTICVSGRTFVHHLVCCPIETLQGAWEFCFCNQRENPFCFSFPSYISALKILCNQVIYFSSLQIKNREAQYFSSTNIFYWLHFCLVCLIVNNFLTKFKHSMLTSFKEKTFCNKWKYPRIHLHFASL